MKPRGSRDVSVSVIIDSLFLLLSMPSLSKNQVIRSELFQALDLCYFCSFNYYLNCTQFFVIFIISNFILSFEFLFPCFEFYLVGHC